MILGSKMMRSALQEPVRIHNGVACEDHPMYERVQNVKARIFQKQTHFVNPDSERSNSSA